MKFKKATPNEDYFDLLESEDTGKWQIGLKAMLFGIRVEINLKNDYGPTVFYCCAMDHADITIIRLIFMSVMSKYSEDELTQKILRDIFPLQRIKPVSQDPKLKKYLLSLL